MAFKLVMLMSLLIYILAFFGGLWFLAFIAAIVTFFVRMPQPDQEETPRDFWRHIVENISAN